MRGRQFTTEDEVNEASDAKSRQSEFSTVTKSDIPDGFDGLVLRWKKCLEVEGAYIEE